MLDWAAPRSTAATDVSTVHVSDFALLLLKILYLQNLLLTDNHNLIKLTVRLTYEANL